MCGIFAIFHCGLEADKIRSRALELSKRLRHRGPDWSGLFIQEYNWIIQKKLRSQSISLVNVLAHERLAIVDPENGAQPLFNFTRKIALTVNGEIYNHRLLKNALHNSYRFQTGSDCEVILALYEYFYSKKFDTFSVEPIERKLNDFPWLDVEVDSIEPSDWNPLCPNQVGDFTRTDFDEDANWACKLLNRLDGIFAFVLINQDEDHCFAARDPIGVCPMYVGWSGDGSIWFASEMKALHEDCITVKEFPPGHYYCSKSAKFVRYYRPKWLTSPKLPGRSYDPFKLSAVIEQSVIKRLMCDVPYGVLLSGGLDSSLVAALVCRHANHRVEDNQNCTAWYPRVHTFSIGLKDSPDLIAARHAAHYLKTIHHECVFTIQEALDAIKDVIYHTETYDVTTVRASTPMYLLSRLVKACGIKMLLSGEGADEAFAGYLYFHHAPNAAELHAECRRKLMRLSKYDCLRANKATSAFGVEIRVPFLDREVLGEVMTLDPHIKMIPKSDLKPEDDGFAEHRRIEKFALRQAFASADPPLLPPEILWRRKEQFSDGVGYEWIEALKDYAETFVTDQQMMNAQFLYPHNTPFTKEAFMYRYWFMELFPNNNSAFLVPGGPSIACSTDIAIQWQENWIEDADPSGRSIRDVHQDNSNLF